MESSLPEFGLPDRHGGRWGTRALLGRREMVLVLLDHDCERCRALLEVLAGREQRDNLSGAAVLVVVTGEALSAFAGYEPPFPLLLDEDGAVGRALARAAGLRGVESAILVADRSGQVLWANPVHAEPPEVLANDAVESVDALGLQCPE